jgi:uncharacterized lipoprotein YddW (UPF0748 family)
MFVLVQWLSAQSQTTKYEYRAAWIATVVNLDWPSSRGLDPQSQRNELISLLDRLAAVRVNAVVFQIRPECDAFYNSPYEPWSYWLTGTQGTAPSDGYDPLTFAAAEAHKRGMEIHAWFNPYRAERSVNAYQLSSTHVIRKHPNWAIRTTSMYVLNPGLDSVRNFVAEVIADVVRRYDVDGVHMDDYFYPYPGESFTTEDDPAFAADPRGFTNKADWRRDNVNLLIKQIYDSVQAIKPWVKVGMSPFGIWKSGVPTGISGMSSYDAIYCDPVAWLQGKYVDYLTPQLYWPFGGGQDYGLLQPWWASQMNGRHFYPGMATYNVSANEIGKQIRLGRALKNAQGSTQFRAYHVVTNIGGVTDTLLYDVFLYPSIIPPMSWKETIPPNTPSNVRLQAVPNSSSYALYWEAPSAASDGDTARRYAVYRFTKSGATDADQNYFKNLIGLVGTTTCAPNARVDTGGVGYYFAVASVDKNNNESGLSNIVSASTSIPAPMLSLPADVEQNFKLTTAFQWKKATGALMYQLQVANQPSFGPGTMIADLNTVDTIRTIAGFQAQKTYYWRVTAGDQLGTSQYSAVRSFRAGWPTTPSLLAPVLAVNVSLLPSFSWTRGGGISFQIQLGTTNTFAAGTLTLDTVVTDTVLTCQRLLASSKVYYWRVKGSNLNGASDWAVYARFMTGTSGIEEPDATIPTVFALSQNYPNPFNAQTTIRFDLSTSGPATLRVYDLLGRQIAVLVDRYVEQGRHTLQFDSGTLPSGIYVYSLVAGGERLNRKLVIIK